MNSLDDLGPVVLVAAVAATGSYPASKCPARFYFGTTVPALASRLCCVEVGRGGGV